MQLINTISFFYHQYKEWHIGKLAKYIEFASPLTSEPRRTIDN